MRRRNLRGDPAVPGAPVQEKTPPPASQPVTGRATMKVEMSGDPDTVRRKMNLNDEEKGGKTQDRGSGDAIFFEALKNPEYKLRVKRRSPSQWQGQDARVIVYEEQCPMVYNSLVEEVTAIAGGRQFLITIYDPSNGKVIAAKDMEVPADPILKKKDSEDEDEVTRMLSEEPPEPDDVDRLAATMGKQVLLAEKHLTLERTQDMLDSLKRKRDRGSAPQDDAQIRRLEQELAEQRHQRELDRQQAIHDKELAEMKASIAMLQNSGPQKGAVDPSIVAILDGMRKSQEAADARMDRWMEQQREDKVDKLLKEVRDQRAGGGLGTLGEQIKAVKAIRDIFDGGDGDEDDDSDDKEPKEWWEKLIDHVPKIMDKLSEMSKGGKKVTKDEFMKEIDDAAEKATREEIEKLQRQNRPAPLPAPAAPQALPAPAADQGSVGRPVTKPAVTQVAELPPAAPAAAPAPEASAPAAPAAPEVPIMPPDAQAAIVEKEILSMATGVVLIIEHELELRKRLYEWNYQGAWQNLPEAMLEKVCTSPDPASMLDALRIQGLPQEVLSKIDGIKARISESPRAAAWIARGHKELQRWWKALEADPDFDPADEDEAEEPEEAPAE